MPTIKQESSLKKQIESIFCDYSGEHITKKYARALVELLLEYIEEEEPKIEYIDYCITNFKEASKLKEDINLRINICFADEDHHRGIDIKINPKALPQIAEGTVPPSITLSYYELNK